MNSPNPTPSAAAMAAAKEIFYWPEPNDELTRGEWTAIMAAIIDKHFAAQREAIGAGITAVEKAMLLSNGRWCEWGERAESVRDALNTAIAQLRAVHSGCSTGQAKEGTT